MEKVFRFLLLVSLASFLFSTPVFALSFTISASQHVWVDETTPSTNSSDNLVKFSNNFLGESVQTYFKFNLEMLPDNALISLAKFRWYNYGTSFTTGPGFVVDYDRYVHFFHVADDSWSENDMTWNTRAGYDAYLGKTAPGSAQGWQNVYFIYTAAGINNWTSSSIDLNDNFLSFVGLIPVTENHSTAYTGHLPEMYFEYTVPEGPPSPVPEPGTLLLLSSGLAGLAIYRRRLNKA